MTVAPEDRSWGTLATLQLRQVPSARASFCGSARTSPGCTLCSPRGKCDSFHRTLPGSIILDLEGKSCTAGVAAWPLHFLTGLRSHSLIRVIPHRFVLIRFGLLQRADACKHSSGEQYLPSSCPVVSLLVIPTLFLEPLLIDPPSFGASLEVVSKAAIIFLNSNKQTAASFGCTLNNVLNCALNAVIQSCRCPPLLVNSSCSRRKDLID